ncbi:MAG: ATPase, partial [Gammaproteobacteria bacterium CG22_combo_CG10-13_8_21_14_all_40_8]
RQLQIPDSSVSFLQAGIMGATFFMTSFFSLILAQRAVAAEAKALERSQALEHLRKMNEKVIQHMKTGVLVVNHLQKIELFNQAAWKLLGMPENLQQAFLPQINTQLARELKQWLKHKNYRPTIIQSKSEALDLNVSFQFFSTDATIKDQVLIFLEDLSTLTQTAQHLKLSSLGRLTGSIAHEIRNPLGALSHAAQLLEESDSLCPEDKSLLKIILNHTERMNLMIENIMNLSQRKQAKTQSIQLDLLLLHFKNDFVLSRTPKPEIEVLINPPRISIQFDLTQFIQVVTNLCENAARFSYEKTQVPLVKMQAGIRYGSKQPFLDIIDQGQGVAVQDVEHIFEPFFTTSPKGSGLGLYLARELCEANGARLEYIPIPSGGACFRINFTENTEST